MNFKTIGTLTLAALSLVALAGCVTAPPTAAPSPVVVQTPAAPSVVVAPRVY